jgi:acyl dehydratase
MTDRWFEDFKIGDKLVSAHHVIKTTDIIGFANQFDPQYFHTSPEAAAAGPFEGLIASGWHICSLAFRLFMDTNPYGKSSLGAPGVDNIRWVKPVRPDDIIQVNVVVEATRLSKSRPDRGIVQLDWSVINQDDDVVVTMQGPIMLLCRPE